MQKRDAVIRALKYGNLIELPLEIEGKAQSVYVSANPEMKNLNIFSKDMQPIKHEQIFFTTNTREQANQSNMPLANQKVEPDNEQKKSKIGR